MKLPSAYTGDKGEHNVIGLSMLLLTATWMLVSISSVYFQIKNAKKQLTSVDEDLKGRLKKIENQLKIT